MAVAQIFARNQVDEEECLSEVDFVLTELVEGLIFLVGDFEVLGRGEDERELMGLGRLSAMVTLDCVRDSTDR